MRCKKIFEDAKSVIPGGVNSPIRAFKALGIDPIIADRGDGAYLYDADNNRYIDYCMSFGAMLLGHARGEVVRSVSKRAGLGSSFGLTTQGEVELAQKIISKVSFVEKVRFVNSGTEATMTAVRLARGATKKKAVIRFIECYHGHADLFIDKAGSYLANEDFPNDRSGINTSDVFVVTFNDRDSVISAVKSIGEDLSAIIVEPFPANNGLIIPRPDFLNLLRILCNETGALLIFDEVISGFRLGLGMGAASIAGVDPDIVTYGKVIGGGYPVAAVGGLAVIMDHLMPEGSVFQAGTLSGNSVAMAAGLTTLEILENGDYTKLLILVDRLAREVNGAFKIYGLEGEVVSQDSIFWINFGKKNFDRFRRFYQRMLTKGIYFSPHSVEVNFLSFAHTLEDVEYTVEQIVDFIRIEADNNSQ